MSVPSWPDRNDVLPLRYDAIVSEIEQVSEESLFDVINKRSDLEIITSFDLKDIEERAKNREDELRD